MVSLTINGSAQNQTLDGTKSYDSVTIINGGTLFVTAYNGTGTTGTLILNVTGNVNVDATSSIIGDAKGYTGGGGGHQGTTDCYWSTAGLAGTGPGAGSNGGGTNCTITYAGGGAGGAGYGTAGGNGGAGYNAGGGSGGPTYGTNSGSDIAMGSGGGGGGGSGSSGNPGDAGGAALTINAANVYIYGTVSCNGGNGGAGSGTTYGAGAGGGGGASGGGILINATGVANFSGATIRANGGSGGAKGAFTGGGSGAAGSPGGGGRIKIFYGSTYTAPSLLQSGYSYLQQFVGNASFSSTPSGATIWIDGSSTGVTTPNTISNLATGGHNYSLKLSGYADVSGSFSVTANSTTTVPLVTFSGSAYITSTPSVARIYLAVSPGTPSDQGVYTSSTFTGLTAASSGSTTLWNYRLTLSGYADATGSFTATAGQTVNVPISFPPSASFTSTPTGARIWIDGVDKGLNTPGTITNLTAGSRNYTLKLTGYADATGSFIATSGSTTTVSNIVFAPSATFGSTPSGGSIYIDNVLQVATTPTTITGLTAGSHTYKLFLAGYNVATGSFNTTAGSTTTIPTVLLIGTAMAFLSAGD